MTADPRACVNGAELAEALLDRITTGAPVGIHEAERRRREARSSFDQLAFPVAVFERDDRLPSTTNRAWCALFGERGDSPAMSQLREHVARVAQTGEGIDLPELALEVDHRPLHVAATLRPQRGCLGATTGAIVTLEVITEEVVAQQLGVDRDALVWSGPKSAGPDFFNARWLGYTGFPAEEPPVWHDAIHPNDLARCVHALGQASRHRLSTDIDVRLLRHDGTYRWHRLAITSGAHDRWYASAVDIHEARLAEAERSELLGNAVAARADAEQSMRLKDQFVAAVSHELRTPVTTMLLWERVLRDDTIDAAMRAQALSAIHEAAMTQSRLVGDLLDVSRAISGKLHVDLHTIDLAAIAREALVAITAAASAKRIAIEQRGTEDTIEVQGDALRLRQIFDNLLSNAVKFTEPSGAVTLVIRRSGPSVVVDVSDTGRGIAPEFLPRIFEPFSQTDDILTRTGGGLGLGLAIAKQLVELLRGTLTATSAGPRCGARFSLTLPIAPRAPSPATRTVAGAPGLERIRILVVDDDRRVRDALSLLLNRRGAFVATAASAQEARARIAGTTFDVIVCDIAMPEEDGYELIATLRAAAIETPAIALTAHALDTDAARASVAGFDLHLAKPIDFERLVTEIDQVVVRAQHCVKPEFAT